MFHEYVGQAGPLHDWEVAGLVPEQFESGTVEPSASSVHTTERVWDPVDPQAALQAVQVPVDQEKVGLELPQVPTKIQASCQ